MQSFRYCGQLRSSFEIVWLGTRASIVTELKSLPGFQWLVICIPPEITTLTNFRICHVSMKINMNKIRISNLAGSNLSHYQG
jgi:hypothetical protein